MTTPAKKAPAKLIKTPVPLVKTDKPIEPVAPAQPIFDPEIPSDEEIEVQQHNTGEGWNPMIGPLTHQEISAEDPPAENTMSPMDGKEFADEPEETIDDDLHAEILRVIGLLSDGLQYVIKRPGGRVGPRSREIMKARLRSAARLVDRLKQ